MMAVGLESLESLYRYTDDPWHFDTSSYEQTRFEVTLASLPESRYQGILEIGCGNGALAEKLAGRTSHYVGVDAVERALVTARSRLPRATFHQLYLPGALPEGHFDLLVLSEILYFLDRSGVVALAHQITTRWPAAGVLCVNYLGDTANELQGIEALDILVSALPTGWVDRCKYRSADFRVDYLFQADAGDTRC